MTTYDYNEKKSLYFWTDADQPQQKNQNPSNKMDKGDLNELLHETDPLRFSDSSDKIRQSFSEIQ
jgi:hypothetical protein